MPRTERGRELARRRARKDKLTKLRAKYAAAKTDAERQEIYLKARRISPFVEMDLEKAAATAKKEAAPKK